MAFSLFSSSISTCWHIVFFRNCKYNLKDADALRSKLSHCFEHLKKKSTAVAISKNLIFFPRVSMIFLIQQLYHRYHNRQSKHSELCPVLDSFLNMLQSHFYHTIFCVTVWVVKALFQLSNRKKKTGISVPRNKQRFLPNNFTFEGVILLKKGQHWTKPKNHSLSTDNFFG